MSEHRQRPDDAPPPGAPQTALSEAAEAFCLIDIDIALGLLDRAQITSDPVHRDACRRLAERAYHSIAHFIDDIPAGSDERGHVEERLTLLRGRLTQ
jgi:hypothetical protein